MGWRGSGGTCGQVGMILWRWHLLPPKAACVGRDPGTICSQPSSRKSAAKAIETPAVLTLYSLKPFPHCMEGVCLHVYTTVALAGSWGSRDISRATGFGGWTPSWFHAERGSPLQTQSQRKIYKGEFTGFPLPGPTPDCAIGGHDLPHDCCLAQFQHNRHGAFSKDGSHIDIQGYN
ncbi:SLIT-ROBO Rho GTPase-activating protein 1 [Platysternon megacephalum]|uniref:Oxidoreductase n=1 Tax=Platysternon megacephalum TaxID=55544 RepID=A0A4D9DDW9_9SAUR|nr:oxidoreductase [Platysternon megacephalum]TFK08717.1 SLIT-ROBO Rho GTPase-activating protein 1 [Platysternon megacephalum]